MYRVLDWFVVKYYRLWACPRGHHKMKLSGCMYCGEGGGTMRFNVRLHG